jgi:hypothetical protein
VVVEYGARHSLAEVETIRARVHDRVMRLVPTLQGVGYDEGVGAIHLDVHAPDEQARANVLAKCGALAELYGMPVQIAPNAGVVGIGEAAGRPAAPACERLGAAEARALPGLKRVGRVGEMEIFGSPRGLLCSEPALGAGECELVGPTAVRIIDRGQVYGFRASGATPAVLRYGPAGATCGRLQTPPAPGPR